MPTYLQFPDEAIVILRRVAWNPSSTRTYDGMAGGFFWDDEFPREAIHACTRVDNRAFRAVIAYRASLVVEEPRMELRPPWDQLARSCPAWPGFRLERRSIELRSTLERANRRFMASLERIGGREDARVPGELGLAPPSQGC